MKRWKAGAAVAIAGAISMTANSAFAQVVNGDFSLGNVGFETQYFERTNADPAIDPICGGPQMPNDCYAVVSDSRLVHQFFTLDSDHTPPPDAAGLMMVVNGAMEPRYIWRQSVNVVAGSSYLFEVWVSALEDGDPSPANLLIQVDPGASCATATETSFQTIGTVNARNTMMWVQNRASINPTAGATQMCIRLVNNNNQPIGNDFALDDISLVVDSRIPTTVADSTTTALNTPVTLDVLTNDVPGSEAIDVNSVDLDPGVPGVQTSKTVTGGTFTVAPGGGVTFTPDTGFTGTATTDYLIASSSGVPSLVSTISVTVGSPPTPTPIPTLSEWGLLILSGLMAVLTLGYVRKTTGHRRS